MDNPKRPPPSKVYEIADRADTPEGAVRLLAEAFPEAETQYIADLFQQREAEQTKKVERFALEKKAARAARNFLADSGYVNLAEACEDLRLAPQDLWDQIMEGAGIPKHEMPAIIQTGWSH